ncbi:MAG TPA: hypothetical protein VKA65_01120 [Acidimicrobiales bacterium]|nr:hypothetical protein [Acidimicrobiales bacterium]
MEASDALVDEACRVFGPDAGSPEGLVAAPIGHQVVASATAGLWRVRAGDRRAVVKVLTPTAGAGSERWRSGVHAAHWYYWRREADAYASGLLASLSGGLRAPACHLVAARPDGTVALWLDDVAGTPATAWPLERYGVAARHLGEAQGAFVAGRPLPADGWLSRDWLRAYVAQRHGDLAHLGDAAAWRHPDVAAWFPRPPVDELAALWADRGRFLAVLDTLPRTVAHLDLHPANMFAGEAPGAGPDDATVVIDWAFVGVAAVGEDPGNLVPDAVLDFHVPPDRLADLEDVVAEGYHAGLRAAGWTGSLDDVRLAMAAAMVAKFGWLAPFLLRAASERRERLNGRPFAEAVAAWAPTIRFLLERADEVRAGAAP